MMHASHRLKLQLGGWVGEGGGGCHSGLPQPRGGERDHLNSREGDSCVAAPFLPLVPKAWPGTAVGTRTKGWMLEVCLVPCVEGEGCDILLPNL